MDTGFYCPATLAARHGRIMSLPPPVVTARPHGFAAWRLVADSLCRGQVDQARKGMGRRARR